MTVAAATYLDRASHAYVADVLGTIDAAVAQEHAIPLVHGRPWSEFFTPISPEQLRVALIESIAWSESQPADSEFARVNARRSRYYLDHAEWTSKEDAAR